MSLYKFLAVGATAPFTGFRWPAPRDMDSPGDWVTVRGPLDPCRAGLHLCRAVDLPFWILDELYAVEVDGPVEEYDDFVLARRARLARRVDPWGPDFASSFSGACVRRVRDLVAEGLPGTRHDEIADRLLRCETTEDVLETAQGLLDGGRAAGPLIGYLLDAARYTLASRSRRRWSAQTAAVALITATAARAAARPGEAEAALAGERARQAHWLTDHVLAAV